MASNFDEAFAAVKSLAKDFDAQKDFYLSPKYQEAEVRKEFIDKFLIALGWDVNHDRQKNPYEQEVKIERKEHGISQRRADYAFYLAPNFRDVKFYIEAKKPFGDIATPDNYFQTIRYGWNSQTPVAALFDFEQFEIVDCRFKPNLETALQHNLKKFKYTEYADQEKFAEIYWLFSREAVAGGALEKYAESLPKKRGAMLRGSYQSIDEAFLEELDAHRDALAHIFKNHNPELDGDKLTEATQRTLDRLVFIRFLEDKLIEPQNLVARFGERGGAWGDFIAASRRLDGIYNGIVFKKNDILDTPTFKVDDNQFSEICKKLSHVNSAYDFNTIPIHILGSIYERFLGKVIVATDKRARVEEKPEVRKAGGVYYTPEYIVRYIVENTVGKLIEGKTPVQIAEMRFADIACGSGSFLLGVYDLLIRHHTKFYNENPGKAKKGDVMKREDGLHLSLQKKREILVNNIFGVDIDNQAVEVAQLSLYLKLLQDETPGSTRQYILDFEQQALLPTLNKNIVCGNSLIGTDILSGELFEPVEERKLNPMDFEDRFPQIFRRKTSGGELHDAAPGELDYTVPGVPLHGSFSYKKSKKDKAIPSPALPVSEFEGGFDAIVGNPPYLYSAGQARKEYFQERFETSEYQTDFYVYFIERAIKLLKQRGVFGMIVSDSWIKGKYFTKLRDFLFSKTALLNVTVFDYPPFAEATIENSVVFVRRDKPEKAFPVFQFDAPSELKKLNSLTVEDCSKLGFIDVRYSNHNAAVIAKIETHTAPLGKFCRLNRGVHAYRTDGYGKSKFSNGTQTKRDKDEQSYHATKKLDKTYFPEIKGKHLERYNYHWDGNYISYGDWLAEARTPEFFFNPKLAIRKIIAPKLVCTFIKGDVILDQSVYVAIQLNEDFADLRFLLGILSSSIGGWYIKNKYGIYDTLYPWFTKEQLANFPIAMLDFKKPADKARHDKLVSLVEQMLVAKPQLARAQSDKDKDFYENKCAALDRQIDALVYELYGLTPDEIKIVENAE
jgi:type I restriction-modification system DNA methylase subunit